MTLKELRSVLSIDPLKIWFGTSTEHEPDFFTRAIRKYQGTKYSHVLCIFYSRDLGDYIIANAHGQAAQLDLLEQSYEIDCVLRLFEKTITPEQRVDTIDTIVKLDGIDYSEMQILDILMDRLFKLRRRKPNKLKGIICSEYVELVGMAAGLPSGAKYLGKSREILTPLDNVTCWERWAKVRDDFKELTRPVKNP